MASEIILLMNIKNQIEQYEIAKAKALQLGQLLLTELQKELTVFAAQPAGIASLATAAKRAPKRQAVPKVAVAAKKKRTRTRITQELRDKVATLRMGGGSHNDIAEKLGISSATVGRILQKLQGGAAKQSTG